MNEIPYFNKMIHYERLKESSKLFDNSHKGKLLKVLNNLEPVFNEIVNYIRKEDLSVLNLEGRGFEDMPPYKQWHSKCLSLRKNVPDMSDDHLERCFNQFSTLFGFWANNERVFKLSNELYLALNETKGNPLIDYIKLPYDTIYIVFPPGRVKTTREHGESCIIEGAYLNIRKHETIRALEIASIPRDSMISGDCVAYYPLLKKGCKLDDIKNQYKDRVSNGIGLEAFTFIIKSIMYMTSLNIDKVEMNAPALGKINKKKFRKTPSRTKSRLPYYLLGRDIQIDNKHTSGGESTGTGRSLTTRFTVRGYFSHRWKIRTEEITDEMVVKTREDGQVYVSVYVAPHWKGPEYGDVILKNYKVT